MLPETSSEFVFQESVTPSTPVTPSFPNSVEPYFSDFAKNIRIKFQGWDIRPLSLNQAQAASPPQDENLKALADAVDLVMSTHKRPLEEESEEPNTLDSKRVRACPKVAIDGIPSAAAAVSPEKKEPRKFIKQVIQIKRAYRKFAEESRKQIIKGYSTLKILHTVNYPKKEFSIFQNILNKNMNRIQDLVDRFQEILILNAPSKYPFTIRNPLPHEESIELRDAADFRHYKLTCQEVVKDLGQLSMQSRQVSLAHALLNGNSYKGVETNPKNILERIDTIVKTKPNPIWMFLPVKE